MYKGFDVIRGNWIFFFRWVLIVKLFVWGFCSFEVVFGYIFWCLGGIRVDDG